MTIRAQKRGRSPPQHSSKRRKLSQSADHSSSSNSTPARSFQRSYTPTTPPLVHKRPTATTNVSNRSPIRPTIRSEIHKPPIHHRPTTPPSPNVPKRRTPRSPIVYRRRTPSPVVYNRRDRRSPIATNRRRDVAPIRRELTMPVNHNGRAETSQIRAVNSMPIQAAVQPMNPRVVHQSAKRKLVMSIKNQAKANKKVRVLKLENVSNNIPLSKLLHEFIVEVSSIIGCHRVTDYDAHIIDGIVFLYLTDEKEFNDLLSRDYLIIEGCIILIKDPKLIYGHAKYVIPFATASSHDMRMTPHPLGLFGFRQLPVTTTFYVIAVLRELEQEGTITGFKLAFCERKKTTRNFGFVTFMNRVNLFNFLKKKKINIMGDAVELKLPDGMPFLVDEHHEHLVSSHRCEFSEEIRVANWLNVNFLNPTLPMRPLAKGEVFIPPAITQSDEPAVTKVKPRTFPPVNPEVIKHNTPPASPTLSIGEDYEMDEDGILARPSTFWLNANAD